MVSNDLKLLNVLGARQSLGCGNYFYTTSAYCARLATPNHNGHKYMFRARVLTGEWGQGKKDIKAAPYKGLSEQYDSVVDNVIAPTIFVVFRTSAAYPEYLVKFM